MMRSVILGMWAMVLVVSSASGQGTITLRPRLAVETKADITLGMVAVVEGVGADTLSSVVVVPQALFVDGLVIGVGRIRELVEKAPGVNAGRFAISGQACKLVFQPATAPEPSPRQAPETSAMPVSDGDSVRGRIRAKLAEVYGVSEDNLRLKFDDTAPAILAEVVIGRVVAIDLGGTGDRVPVQVRIFDGDRLAASATVRTTPSIRRSVTRAGATIAKGEIVIGAMLVTNPDWLPPSIAVVPIESIVGKAARTRIGEGQVVEERHVQARRVVSKGDVCMVDCVSGGLIIQLRARALAHACEDEVVQFQSLSGKRSFAARVSGPERAVMEVAGR